MLFEAIVLAFTQWLDARRALREQQNERRVLGRQLIDHFPVTFTTYHDQTEMGQTINLSILGAGILARRCYSPGTVIQIHVPAAHGDRASFLSAEVRHVALVDDDFWLLGCFFAKMMTVREIVAFG
jgi:hypothetical protein